MRQDVRGAVAVALVTVLSAVLPAGCGAEPPEERSDLDAYLDEIFAVMDAESYAARYAAQEEVLAACMAEAGFEYYPQAAPPLHQVEEVLSPEYAAEFGYGYTTEAYGPGVAPLMFSQRTGDDAASDENDRYRMSLSAEAREEYSFAMHGRELAPDEHPDDRPPAEAGCSSRAAEEAFGDYRVPREFEPLDTAIREEVVWADADPRVTATHPLWDDCMADAGYPGLTAVEEANWLVTERVNGSSMAADRPYDELKEANGGELAELQQFEIAVAVADATCREESGWYEVRAQVKAEAEDSILERYGPELDAWLEWVRERRAATG